MAFKTWVAGDVLTASDMMTYLMRQAVIVCTSGTRPSSPVEGMTIFETDTDAFLFYDGAAWKRTGHHVAHQDIAFVAAGGARSITSTAYTDWPTDVVQIASFVKYRADTILVVEAAVTNVWSDAAANYGIGIRVNAVDYDCANISVANSVGNYHTSGWNKITGLAAGTYTCVFRHKISASTMRADAQTRILLKVAETMDKG